MPRIVANRFIVRFWGLVVAPIMAAAICLNFSSCGGGRGPSEAEMRQAIQDRIDTINQNLAGLKNTPVDRNDPISAIQRLAGVVMGDARLKIAAFKKLGAVPANGKPGFMCDYMLQLTMEGGNSPVLASFMNRLGGSIITARFVKTDRNWIWIPPDSEGGR